MTETLRLMHVVMQPVAVWDDGESLRPGPQLQPFTVPLGDLDAFPARVREEFAKLRAQVESAVEIDPATVEEVAP